MDCSSRRVSLGGTEERRGDLVWNGRRGGGAEGFATALRIAVGIMLLLAIGIASRAETPTPTSAPAGTSEAFGKLYPCKPGPWGDLEYYHVYLEPPERLWQQVVLPDPVTKWKFPGGTEASVRAVFERAKLSAVLQDYLLHPDHRVIEDDVLTVFPPLPDLLAMTPEQRASVYAELGKSSLNSLHAEPVRIMDGDPDLWLAQSPLRPPLREAVKKLVYMRGTVMCFSDVPAIVGMAQSEKEARAAAKAMWRTPSLVLQLNLKGNSDLAQVVQYWSGPPHSEDIASLVQPAAQVEGVQRLDCVHLLPPLPRRYLYRYPSQDLMISSQEPDCNWTSMNFFNSTPFNLYDDGPELEQRLVEGYAPVEPPYRFGDVLLLIGPGNIFVHSCVHLADDIVYTKNGKGRLRPWQLMKLGDVVRYYGLERTLVVKGFRMKEGELK